MSEEPAMVVPSKDNNLVHVTLVTNVADYDELRFIETRKKGEYITPSEEDRLEDLHSRMPSRTLPRLQLTEEENKLLKAHPRNSSPHRTFAEFDEMMDALFRRVAPMPFSFMGQDVVDARPVKLMRLTWRESPDRWMSILWYNPLQRDIEVHSNPTEEPTEPERVLRSLDEPEISERLGLR